MPENTSRNIDFRGRRVFRSSEKWWWRKLRQPYSRNKKDHGCQKDHNNIDEIYAGKNFILLKKNLKNRDERDYWRHLICKIINQSQRPTSSSFVQKSYTEIMEHPADLFINFENTIGCLSSGDSLQDGMENAATMAGTL